MAKVNPWDVLFYQAHIPYLSLLLAFQAHPFPQKADALFPMTRGDTETDCSPSPFRPQLTPRFASEFFVTQLSLTVGCKV